MYNKKGFTTGEVAELCHVTIPTVIKWIETGELEGFKIPGSKNRRITRESLLKFMKKHRIPTTYLEKSKIKILVVDDEKNILELFKAIFEDTGDYELRLVSKGFEAGLCKEFKPDLVILDIMLPDIDGRQVCRYIRDIPELKKVKILAISGKMKEDTELAKLVKKGFDDYLVKPFSKEEIINKTNALINK